LVITVWNEVRGTERKSCKRDIDPASDFLRERNEVIRPNWDYQAK
jgi:hypothetical protein